MATEEAKKDETKPEAAAASGESGGKSKMLFVSLGLCCVLGAVLAMVAIPKKVEHKHALEGPFVAALSKENLQVNLAGENGKRYLVLNLNAEYFAYAESYVAARLGATAAPAGGHGGGEATGPDPLYTAMLKDTLLRVAGRKTREQVEDPVQMEAFLMEVRTAVEPLLFPVCIGDSSSPQVADLKSGLLAGESVMESTFRGLLHEHALRVDAEHKSLRLDDGPDVSFKGEERDLKVTAKDGTTSFVNVTRLDPKFSGDVPIGVAGRVRRIYRQQVLVQ
jgi:flagellar basal body-associated protein FliL